MCSSARGLLLLLQLLPLLLHVVFKSVSEHWTA
jgi:hypothetical protein